MIQSFAVITKTGKVICSRQNVPFTRTKIEGLYATFTRMASTTPHSSFEAESVRFVYRLIEDVYFVVITTLSSNIIEDTEILNAVIACVQTKMTITSKSVTQQMFEIVFILDEFLQWGFCEKLSVQNVRTNLAMRSRDEELYLQQKELKEQEALRIARQKAEELREEKELKEKLEMMQKMQNNMVNQMRSGNDYSPLSDYAPSASPVQQNTQTVKKNVPKKPVAKQATKGLQLGKKKQAETLIEEIKKEEQIVDEEPQQVEERKQSNVQQNQTQQKQQKKEKKLMLTSCAVKVVEESHITVSAESSTVTLAMNGSLAVAVAEGCNPEIALGQVGIAAKAQMNPAIDAKAFTQRIVKVKEGKKFAVNTPATYIKWSFKSNDYELPITFTCWPAESDNGLTLSLSYECAKEMKYQNLEMLW